RGTLGRSYTSGVTDTVDEGEVREDADRPFEQWLDDYLSEDITADPIGELGAKCRDAADRLVSELLRNPSARARARFTRSLAFFIYDSYICDNWEAYEK